MNAANAILAEIASSMAPATVPRKAFLNPFLPLVRLATSTGRKPNGFRE
jgi:hypothetical protein